MSTYYLFDMHVPDVSDARIVDVVTAPADVTEIRVDGLIPIRIPEGVQVKDPTSLDNLLSQKYLGLLAMYPGFAHVHYDALLDSSGLVSGIKLGSRMTIGGTVTTAEVDTSPVIVSRCVLVTEHYAWRYVDRHDGRIERYYVELSSAEIVHALSLNGGAISYDVYSGQLLEADNSDNAGSGIVLTLNAGASAVDGRLPCTASWALIY